MLVCEDLLLLLTNDETGKKLAYGDELDLALGGALLTDLTLAGHVRRTEPGEEVRKNRVVLDPEVPAPDHPLLREAYDRLGRRRSWSRQSAVRTLARGAMKRIYQQLVREEQVQRVAGRAMGIFPVTRYVPIETEHEKQLLAEIDAALLEGGQSTVATAALVALLHALGKLVAVVDRGRGVDKRAVKAQAKTLMQQYWQAKAAYDAIQADRAGGATS